MDINLTIIGQSIAFAVFCWFCHRYVWPLFANVLEERKRTIAEGLEAAAQAELKLESASRESAEQLDEAKNSAADIIEQANRRATQIIDEAKQQAIVEAERVMAAARAEIEQEANRAKEELRAQVSVIAIAGAEKILAREVDRSANEEMLAQLAAEL